MIAACLRAGMWEMTFRDEVRCDLIVDVLRAKREHGNLGETGTIDTRFRVAYFSNS
jgi:hypothetical protein